MRERFNASYNGGLDWEMAKLRWPNSVLHYGGTIVDLSPEAVYGDMGA